MGKLPLMGRYHKLPRKLSSDYTLTSKVLGTGCNGSVRMANSINSKNQQAFAVKTFNTKGMKADKLEHLQAEIEIFLCMDHPQVARLVDVYESEHTINLVMQCMVGGELFDRVMKHKRFPEVEAADATKQMLLAVNYVHSHGIVHRDLKLENFLYDTQGSTHLRLIDFGFSKFYDTKHRMHTSCGTLAYVAPEVLNRSYTSQCDLWSMGVIVFILLSGHMPFYGQDDAQIRNISKGHFVMKSEHWVGVSSQAKSFVRGLLEVNPDKRLTAKAALQQPWILRNCQEPQLDFQPTVSALRSWLAAPPLLRASMCMMAWTLTDEQQAMVRDHFLAIDTNHDGAVSSLELKDVMVKSHGVAEDEVDAIFTVLTAAHDREVHYSDFLAAVACESIVPDDDLLRATFSRFDTKGSGLIVAEDFHNLLGVSVEDGHADAFVREADKEGRGSINFADFSSYVRNARLKMKSPEAKAVTITLPPEATNPTLLGSQRRSGPVAHEKTIKDHAHEPIAVDLDIKDACCNLM